MEFVQPIKDEKHLEDMNFYLERYRTPRDVLFFNLGINCGLRVSDLLELKVKDVQGRFLRLRESKTTKVKEQEMAPELIEMIQNYTKHMQPDDYLFPSRKRDKNGNQKPISRIQAYDILKAAANFAGLDIPIGTHSLRKTFAYFMYKQTKDIALVQRTLNHDNSKDTLRYIGVDQEEVNKVTSSMFISTKPRGKGAGDE